MRALLIEDDEVNRRQCELALASEGIITECAEFGVDGLECGKIYDYDIIILDIGLPDIDGYELLMRFRHARIDTPIMILSNLSGTDNAVKGLTFGADDYLSKPYNKSEFVARVRAIIRRSRGHHDAIINIGGGLRVNLENRALEKLVHEETGEMGKNGSKITRQRTEIVHLTGKEYSILELMAVRHKHILTKEMFLSHLYGGMDEPELKIIDVFVCKLRKKLHVAAGMGDAIKTVWGRGYQLTPMLQSDENESSSSSNGGGSAVASVAVRANGVPAKQHSNIDKSATVDN